MTISSREAKSRVARKRRTHTTRRSVRIADSIARWIIAIGGIGTILAISLVAVFLVWTVLPLFRSEHLIAEPAHSWRGSNRSERNELLHMGIDEYAQILWSYSTDGCIRSYQAGTGQLLETSHPFESAIPSAAVFSIRGGKAGFGFSNGTLQLATIEFKTDFLDESTVPSRLRSLHEGHQCPHEGGIAMRTVEGQLRFQRLEIRLHARVKLKRAAAIRLIDVSPNGQGSFFAALDSNGKLHLGKLSQRKNLLTGKITFRVKKGGINLPMHRGELPTFLLLSGLGDWVLIAWRDGTALRYDTRNVTTPALAEKLDLVETPNTQLTQLSFLIGKTSVAVGDSRGRVRVWFRVKPRETTTRDGAVLVQAHELSAGGPPVTALGPSPRSRMLAAGFMDGRIRLYQVTSEKLLAEIPANAIDQNPEQILIAPKDNLLLTGNRDRYRGWAIDAPHPETTLSSVFGRVWYEGYKQPEYVWQSSSGTDDFEPKYGLMPLIFGTLKATCYSMLVAIPLALLAAVYTSEFMQPRAKRIVKPTIEAMASLPSVVLGFLAALVFAPVVEHHVVSFLTCLFTIPFAVLLGAYLWQLLPATVTTRAAKWRLVPVALAMLGGGWLAVALAPFVEHSFFSGNFKVWLDGQIGTGAGAWMLLYLPLSAIVITWITAVWVTPRMRARLGHWSSCRFAAMDMVKFLTGVGCTVTVAYALSWLFQAFAWDPRGSFVATYVQRNTLVVGAIMGFALIPIIFTISDDALSAVPVSLRAASLGAGATPWQTAIRVVIPTAMSGLFSAIMIGLGRAVGETMIVLMAAGNTPVMDWNVFNGFRTLSANIAVELPEAVAGSTHYRMLFVAALVLFAMTFVVNTVAEIVRLRFRKRAFEL